MHALVRRYLKTAIAFLATGLALGLWMLARRELAGAYPPPHLASAHTHAILVGFVMLMILGVALWMFPRPAQDDARYSPARAEAAYWLVAGGTALRLAGEVARPWMPGRAPGWAIVLAGTAQAAGIALFFWTMWARIRPAGSRMREERGERF